eukprot:1612694-Rhodomonas_salina.2
MSYENIFFYIKTRCRKQQPKLSTKKTASINGGAPFPQGGHVTEGARALGGRLGLVSPDPKGFGCRDIARRCPVIAHLRCVPGAKSVPGGAYDTRYGSTGWAYRPRRAGAGGVTIQRTVVTLLVTSQR